jgi:hypothetical protein
MTRQFRAQAGGERSRTGFDLPSIAIEAGEFLAKMDGLEVHESAASPATIILGGVHQPGSDAGLLLPGID